MELDAKVRDPTGTPMKRNWKMGRLAEAARDEGLRRERRELRRLTIESGHLSYFDIKPKMRSSIGTVSGQGWVNRALVMVWVQNTDVCLLN